MRWSYTKISMYLQCPAKFKYKYVMKQQEQTSPAMNRGVEIHKGAEMFLNKEVETLPPELSLYQQFMTNLREQGGLAEVRLSVNRQWEQVPYESQDVWGVGFLDAALIAEKSIKVWDWKTGKIYEDDHEKQRQIYACLASPPEPIPVEVTHVYVDLGKNRQTTYQPHDISALRAKWGDSIARMESDRDLVPTPNWSCRYCSFSKLKGGPCKF